MDPRAGLDGRKNLVPTGIRSRTVQSRSQSLYRLSYPAHPTLRYLTIFSEYNDKAFSPRSKYLLGIQSRQIVIQVALLHPLLTCSKYNFNPLHDLLQ